MSQSPLPPVLVLVVVLYSPSSVFRVVRAKLPPVAFSMLPSSILANRLDPQPRTKDDDEDGRERGLGHDAKQILNSGLGYAFSATSGNGLETSKLLLIL